MFRWSFQCNFPMHSKARITSRGIQTWAREATTFLWVLQSFSCGSPARLWTTASRAILCQQNKAEGEDLTQPLEFLRVLQFEQAQTLNKRGRIEIWSLFFKLVQCMVPRMGPTLIPQISYVLLSTLGPQLSIWHQGKHSIWTNSRSSIWPIWCLLLCLLGPRLYYTKLKQKQPSNWIHHLVSTPKDRVSCTYLEGHHENTSRPYHSTIDFKVQSSHGPILKGYHA